MSDKRPVQQHLAQNLSQMPLDLSPENAVKFLSAFWTTIVREWSGIDRLRWDF